MKNAFGIIAPALIGAVLLTLLTFTARAAGPEQGHQSAIVLDPEIQQEISRVVVALSSAQKTEQEVQAIVNDFKSFRDKSAAELLFQVLAVYGGKEEYRANPQQEMAKRALLANLLQDMSQKDVVEAVAPSFERVTDLKLKKSLQHALDAVAFRNGNVDPDFTAFTAFVEEKKQQPPQALVIDMYQLNPEKALREMSKVFSVGGSRGAEPPSAEVESLKAMAATGNWWESLYVAEQLRRNPGLRDPQLVQQLKGDPSKIVRDVSADLDRKP